MIHKGSKAFYDEEADKYDTLRWRTQAGRFVNECQMNIISEFIHDINKKRVLEIGAGTGRFTEVLLNQDNHVTALDISNHMLDVLSKKLHSHARKNNLILQVGDARNTGFEDNQFDAVVTINALSHIPEYEKVLSEVSRILKPGGIFVFNVPNAHSVYFPFGIYVNLRKKAVLRDVYTRWYNYKEIVDVLDTYALRVEALNGQLQIPTKSPDILVPVARWSCRLMKSGCMAKYAPILFIKARKA